MATLWTTHNDVLDRWVGGGVPTDHAQINHLINDAEAVILAEYPKIQDRIDAETLPLAVVVMVTSRMVTRVLRNPESLTYWQQNTGPFGQGKNYGSDNADIWLSSEEKELLAPKRKGKAFEIDLAPNARISAVARLRERDLQFMELNGRVEDDED